MTARKALKFMVGDKFTLNCGVTVTLIEKVEGYLKGLVIDGHGREKVVFLSALRNGEVAWWDQQGNILTGMSYDGALALGDTFTLNCGVVVKVDSLKPLVVSDDRGNCKKTNINQLKSGSVSWRVFGVASHKSGSKVVRVGDRVTLYCGVVVTVTKYENCERVTIRDDLGNEKISNTSQIRKGKISWSKFGVRTPNNTDKKVRVGDRIKSKRHGYYEVVEVNNSADIKITWDDYELSQTCTVGHLLRNTLRPRSASHIREIDLLKRFYVYIVRHNVSQEIIYIGKGTGRRLQHVNSGTSHNYYLNQFHFSGNIAPIEIFKDGLDEDASLELEKFLIEEHQPYCNIALNPRTCFDTEIYQG